MLPDLWHNIVSDLAEVLKGKRRCNLPLGLFCSLDPLFKPRSSGQVARPFPHREYRGERLGVYEH